ncbi:6-carboxytetrahydropterin synthase [Phycicoccus sp. HDW14]|uniref:6-pyruvoyl trahydropterin synthase family protein n=1 Tax=Phycicoccus sp. HDW14 TaxID=2714941 RepID=UPI00140A69B4|nr:6-carboxytetrahydropterin synthase [Phycicoccus sp. HDW14]QIM22124.1 6-carboxytetrahydropterin synthase [Phycicoccus sp. HDW14]
MFTLTVSDHTMVAHSLPDPFFGPAQRVHGATYAVDASLIADDLDEHGVVADIGALARALRAVLGDLDHRNLDDDPAFAGVLTTTEVLARTVADRLAGRIRAGALGSSTEHLRELDVTLRESPVAAAGYRRTLGVGP